MYESFGTSDCEREFNDTCQIMREYMKKERPQSFASMWRLYSKQKHRCEIHGIKVRDTSDIVEYAKKEQIERFKFE